MSSQRGRSSFPAPPTRSLRYDVPPSEYGSIDDLNIGQDEYQKDLPVGDTVTPPAPPYSVLRVRLLTSLMVTLYVTGSSTSSMLSQYLLDRWTEEAGQHGFHSNSSVCDRNESDARIQKQNDIQSRVSIAIIYYNYATCGPAIISCVLFGALVDLIGRKPALISSLLGYNLKVVIFMVIIKYNLNTNFFYLAFVLDGIGGGFFVNLLCIFSITADINVHKGTRILWIAIITSLMSVSGAVMGIGQGYLIKYISYFSATAVLMGPLGLSLIVAIFFLPETLPASMRQKSLRRLGEYTKRLFSIYLQHGSKKERWALFLALMIFFTSVLNFINLSTTDTLYQRHRPFCWESTQIGYYYSYRNGVQSIIALIYLKIHQAIGCASDELMAMVGMLFIAGSCVMEAFVKNTWQMYMIPILSIPGCNAPPIIRGVMSYLVGPEKQGVLFSSIAVIEALCQMASTTTYNKVYAATVDFMPGFVYFVMAGVAIFTFLLFIPFFYCYESPKQSYAKLVQAEYENIEDEEYDPPSIY